MPIIEGSRHRDQRNGRSYDLARADVTLVGENDDDDTGWSLAADGDGLGDLLVGALRNDRGGFNAGAAWLVTAAGLGWGTP